MDNNLPFHIRMFNDRVRQLNQTGSKVVTLSSQEARSLHAEIYDLMATISNLSKTTAVPDVITVGMDGGSFK